MTTSTTAQPSDFFSYGLPFCQVFLFCYYYEWRGDFKNQDQLIERLDHRLQRLEDLIGGKGCIGSLRSYCYHLCVDIPPTSFFKGVIYQCCTSHSEVALEKAFERAQCVNTYERV